MDNKDKMSLQERNKKALKNFILWKKQNEEQEEEEDDLSLTHMLLPDYHLEIGSFMERL